MTLIDEYQIILDQKFLPFTDKVKMFHSEL